MCCSLCLADGAEAAIVGLIYQECWDVLHIFRVVVVPVCGSRQFKIQLWQQAKRFGVGCFCNHFRLLVGDKLYTNYLFVGDIAALSIPLQTIRSSGSGLVITFWLGGFPPGAWRRGLENLLIVGFGKSAVSREPVPSAFSQKPHMFSFFDHRPRLAFELCEGQKHIKRQPPHRRGGVELLGDRRKRHPLSIEHLNHFGEVGE